MTTYTPRAIWNVAAAPCIVRLGEGPIDIARRFGRSDHEYADLVGANLDRPLTSRGTPPGHARQFSNLRAGDKLRLPAWWADLGDVVVPDATNQAFLTLLQTWPAAQTPPVTIQFPQEYAMILNAVGQWWSQDWPNVTPSTDPAYVAPPGAPRQQPSVYLQVAVDFWTNFGAFFVKGNADKIPWNEIPWATLPWGQVPWGFVNWPQLSGYLSAHLQAGQVSNLVVANWYNQLAPGMVPKTEWTGFWSQIPWGIVPFADVPWTQIPWTQIDWKKVVGATNRTSAIVGQMMALYGLKSPCIGQNVWTPSANNGQGDCVANCPAGQVWNAALNGGAGGCQAPAPVVNTAAAQAAPPTCPTGQQWDPAQNSGQGACVAAPTGWASLSSGQQAAVAVGGVGLLAAAAYFFL